MGAAVLGIGYRFSGVARLRRELARARDDLHRSTASILDPAAAAARRIDTAASAYVDAWRRTWRGQVPIEALKEAGADRVRWASLRAAGIATLADLDGVAPHRLSVLPGIGENSATKVGTAASRLRSQITQRAIPVPTASLTEHGAADLVAAVATGLDVSDRLAEPANELRTVTRSLIRRADELRLALTFGHWLLRGVWMSEDTTAMAAARTVVRDVRATLGGELLATVTREHVALLGARAVPVGMEALTARYGEQRERVLERIAGAVAPAALSDAPAAVDDGAGQVAEDVAERDPEWTPAGKASSIERWMSHASTPPQPTPAAPRSVPRGAPRWVPPGETVEVQGFTIAGGMLYVGTDRPSADELCGVRATSGQRDPSRIDPTLPIDARSPDVGGEGMPYWPSYATIPPSSRGAYLLWLASGRCDPNFDVGYPFLSLYGFEWRIFAEREQCTPADVTAILAEVERLMGIYGSRSASFRRYATGFLATVRALCTPSQSYLQDPPVAAPGCGESSALLIGLGQLAADGRPVPADWAFAWYVSDAVAARRYAVSRCPDELKRLFRVRYAQDCGESVVLPRSGRRLTFTYQAASAALGTVTAKPDLPDVRGSARALRAIGAVGQACCDALDAYARRIGRVSGDEATLVRLTLLPPELLADHGDDRLRRLRTWLDETVPSSAPVVTPLRELLARSTEKPASRLRKADVTQVALLLGHLGVGIDPDPRFGGGPLGAEDPVALFRLPTAASQAPSAAYSAAATMVQLGCAVAAADKETSGAEREHLERVTRSMDGLEEAERVRLRAYAARLLEVRPGLAGLAKRVAAIEPDARHRLGEFLVRVAAADGRLSPKELETLAKLFTMLGLDPGDVYRQAHALTTDTVAADEPVVVQPATQSTSDFAIPRPTEARRGLQLDMSRVRSKLDEADEVFRTLHGIFAAEDEPVSVMPATVAPTTQPADANEPTVAGLDLRHSRLARVLIERASVARLDFEGYCEQLGLLPDGALEVLNDASFDRHGVPVVEGDDPLDVDLETLRSWITA